MKVKGQYVIFWAFSGPSLGGCHVLKQAAALI